MNPLFQALNQNNNVLQKLQQFQQMFKGNPQEQVQRILNSGRINQEQYNQAVQMANQLQRMIQGK